MSKLYIVGIGPGDLKHMTCEAREAIRSADAVVGYSTYLKLIEPLLAGKAIISSGMTREVERCREAIRLACEGRTVALVSSGDAGVYGMAGLVMELMDTESPTPFANGGSGGISESSLDAPDVVVVPGVSAVQAAAAVLGAPLMHDFAVISLSDLLTPWEIIEKRLAASAAADFVIALYNPRSKGRSGHLERARDIILQSRPGRTPVGIVRNACRKGEERIIASLAEMPLDKADMFSLVIVGNSATFIDGKGRMVTPRGYELQAQSTRRKAQGKTDDTFALCPGAQARALMFVGTGSDVGKSVIAAGFCRILRNRGISVAPFKSQNMALNSFATPEGGEIGRAQAVQAQACGIFPHTDMNPVLLKPNSDTGSQVIVQGTAVGNMSVKEYNSYKPQAFEKIVESYKRLRRDFAFVVIEGAGSIAEINLKSHDIANLRIAEMAGCPCILVADIDRGGVFAQIVGSLELLEPKEKELIRGVIINKFRGDPSLLKPGIDFVEQRTGVPVLGVVPFFTHFRIPEEDSVALEKKARGNKFRHKAQGTGHEGYKLRIGVIRFPRISNYTDFDPLEAETDVELRYLELAEEMDDLDLLILPGSKSTMADLRFLDRRGMSERIRQFRGPIVGICGGYQMLGASILDPHGVESARRETAGLGLLDVETVLLSAKETHQAKARLLPAASLAAPGCSGIVEGYEIHMGQTTLGTESLPFAQLVSRSGQETAVPDGAVSADGRILGTYLHGLFDNDGFRSAYLNRIRMAKGLPTVSADCRSEDPFDLLAEHLERHLDMEKLLQICGIH
ncbi:MAG: cobyric acid synthase [Geobacteraceae bacterium]|nr:cobyric acid synthase [Geobacteraceae bacterium]